MKIFDPQLTGSIKVENPISGSVTTLGNVIALGSDSSLTGSFSGSFTGEEVDLTGSFSGSFKGDDANLTGSFSGSFIGDGADLTGSFTGSFTGDGSGLIGVDTGSWDGQFTGDAEITGSLLVSGSFNVVGTPESNFSSSLRTKYLGIYSASYMGYLAPSGYLESNATNDLGLGSQIGKNIRFYTNLDTTEKMRLTTDGNLGIGIAPSSTTSLHIYKSDPILLIQASNTSGDAELQFFPRDGSNLALLQSIKGNNNGSLVFSTGGVADDYVPTEALTISSGGTVNIPVGTRPTTGKGGALIVGGDADGTGLTTNTRKLGLITCPSFNNSNGNMAMVTGDTSSSTVAKLVFGSINTGYASPTQISFHTTSTVGTIGTEKLTISSGGDVRIGTGKKFIFEDGTATGNSLYRDAATGDTVLTGATDIVLSTSSTPQAMRISSGGDATFSGKISSVKELININSADGTRSLGLESDSSGNIWIGTGTTAATINLVTGNSTNGLPSVNGVKRLCINREGTDVYASYAGNTFPFRVGYLNGSSVYTPTFVIDDNGKVGIGTDDPQQILHINNTSGNFSAEAVLRGSTSTGTPKAEVAFKRATSGDGAGLVLRTSNSSGTLSDSLTIASGGDVTFAGEITHDGLILKTGGTSTNIDTLQTINTILTHNANTWTSTGIEGTDIAGVGSYMVQVYSNAFGVTGGAWYSMYWTGVMSWYPSSTNGVNASEIYLNFAGHALNSNVLELRTRQNTSGGSPANLMSLEIKTVNALSNAPISFRFRRLM